MDFAKHFQSKEAICKFISDAFRYRMILFLTARTISSIWCCDKEVGSFPSLARHAVKTFCLPDSVGC